MVKLARIRETHQLKLVLCEKNHTVEIVLRHMEHVIVVEEISSFGSQPQERSSGWESHPCHSTNIMDSFKKNAVDLQQWQAVGHVMADS